MVTCHGGTAAIRTRSRTAEAAVQLRRAGSSVFLTSTTRTVFNFLNFGGDARVIVRFVYGNAAFGGFPDRANDPAARRGVGVPWRSRGSMALQFEPPLSVVAWIRYREQMPYHRCFSTQGTNA